MQLNFRRNTVSFNSILALILHGFITFNYLEKYVYENKLLHIFSININALLEPNKQWPKQPFTTTC